MKDGRRLKIFSSGRGAGKNKNSGADDGADAERRQRPGAEGFLQSLPWSLGFRNQLVDRLAAEKLVVAGSNSRSAHGDGWVRR